MNKLLLTLLITAAAPLFAHPHSVISGIETFDCGQSMQPSAQLTSCSHVPDEEAQGASRTGTVQNIYTVNVDELTWQRTCAPTGCTSAFANAVCQSLGFELAMSFSGSKTALTPLHAKNQTAPRLTSLTCLAP